MKKKRPFYELPLSYPVDAVPEAQSQRAIPYSEDSDPAALMDITLPAGDIPAGGHAAVLFLHGGPLPQHGTGPWPREWRIFQDYGKLAAINGLAGVMINHRYIGYEGLIQAIADVRQALRFLTEQGAGYGVDGQRVAIWAFSGAAMLLSTHMDGETAALRCLAAFYPMLDLTHVQQAAELYSEDQLIALSPISHIETIPRTLPLFLARAGLDRPGLNRALDTFVKQALYHNLDLELRNLPQAGHGFDMLEETAAVQDTIQRGIDFVKYQLEIAKPPRSGS